MVLNVFNAENMRNSINLQLLLLILVNSYFCQSEGPPLSSPAVCSDHEFTCRSQSNFCISRTKVRDGVDDCPDGSDEDCSADEFDCKFGTPRCIALANLNDGTIDCQSGVDEGCPKHYFVCSDRSTCIDRSRYQDGHKDCIDGSDEICSRGQFMCRSDKKCIAEAEFQDGKADCDDGSDEECTATQFECSCGWPRCIDASSFNNSKTDCDDASDEPMIWRPKTSSNPVDCRKNGDQKTQKQLKEQGVGAELFSGSAQRCDGATSLLKNCKSELQEICLVFGNQPRCMCAMGFFRADESSKCEPFPSRLPFAAARRRLTKAAVPSGSETGSACNTNAECGCSKGLVRHHITGECTEGERISIPLTIDRFGGEPLRWNDDLIDPNNEKVKKLTKILSEGIEMAQSASRIYPFYVNSDVSHVIDPRQTSLAENGQHDGVVFNVTVFMLPACIQDKTVWLELLKSIRNCNYSIGGTDLFLAKSQAFPFGASTDLTKPCGASARQCDLAAGEICQRNGICSCPAGEERRSEQTPCLEIVGVESSLIVIKNGEDMLMWKDKYLNPSSPEYQEIAEKFKQGVHQLMTHTSLHPYYVTTDVNSILNPSLVNSVWTSGLLVNFTLFVRPGTVTRQVTWTELLKALQTSENRIGNTGLISSEVHPNFIDIPEAVVVCGSSICDYTLGEVCLIDGSCGCLPGRARKDKMSPCTNAIAFVLPLRVNKQGNKALLWNDQYNEPTSDAFIEMADLCGLGLHNVVRGTSFYPKYVTNEVRRIIDARGFNESWSDGGLLFNYTIYMRPDAELSHTELMQELLQVIRDSSGAVGGTELYVSEHQPSPTVFTSNGNQLQIVESIIAKRKDLTTSAPAFQSITTGAAVLKTTQEETLPPVTTEATTTTTLATTKSTTTEATDFTRQHVIRTTKERLVEIVVTNTAATGTNVAEALIHSCAKNYECDELSGEVCQESGVCGCPEDTVRSLKDSRCVQATAYNFPLRCSKQGTIILIWTPEYANHQSIQYRELTQRFKQAITEVLNAHPSQEFVSVSVNNVTDARVVNSSWNDGLIFNYTVFLRTDAPKKTHVEVYKDVMKAVVSPSGAVGSSELVVAESQPTLATFTETVEYPLPLRIEKLGSDTLVWQDEAKDYSILIDQLKQGVFKSEEQTALQPYFADFKVHGFLNPAIVNDTWTDGLLCNCSVVMKQGHEKTGPDIWNDVIGVIRTNNYKLYGSSVVLSPVQPDPKFIYYGDGISAFYFASTRVQRLVISTTPTAFAPVPSTTPATQPPPLPQPSTTPTVPITSVPPEIQTEPFSVTIPTTIPPTLPTTAVTEPSTVATPEPPPAITRGSREPETTPTRSVTQSTVLPVIKDTERPQIGGQCSPDVSSSCPGQHELCALVNGSFACTCQAGFVRDSSLLNRCVELVNECASPGLNDCDVNTICMDNVISYECLCKPGFLDMSANPQAKPGRKCIPLVNECQDPNQNDCDENADCFDLPTAYNCSCKAGFKDLSPNLPQFPGRKCVKEANECLQASDNNCSVNATCTDTLDSYECECKIGYVDMSHDVKRGRICKQLVNECLYPSLNDCDKTNGECLDTVDSYVCQCKQGTVDQDPQNPGRSCRPLEDHVLADACESSSSGCSPNATCSLDGGRTVCKCKESFTDLSEDTQNRPGIVCKQLINECLDTTSNDCSRHAHCIDTVQSYSCNCFEGYRDESPADRPGRDCIEERLAVVSQSVTTCDVNDPMACDKTKAEVCRFVNGNYECSCPQGVSRLPNGECKLVDECGDPRLNQCDQNADCIDTSESYRCQCKSGYSDVLRSKPGTVCKLLVNECLQPGIADCDKNADCSDTDDSFSCSCKSGFVDVSEEFSKLPGRKCVVAIDECSEFGLNNCSTNAICTDAKIGYSCRCKENFVDVSPNVTLYPGRVCKARPTDLNLTNSAVIKTEDCDPNNAKPCSLSGEVCERVDGEFVCICPASTQRFEDGSCKTFSACNSKDTNDCDANAICSNTFDSYKCQCKPGFLDRSRDPEEHPGRKCIELINECARPEDNECSAFAKCQDTPESYICSCNPGYVDVSSDFRQPPGRQCYNASNECSLRSLNTCDDNADCVDLPQGYACECAPGFVDVSHSASLPPGRVCTVQTVCNQLSADLLFVVDGSGSIGSFSFQHEVLRFITEFIDLFDIAPDKTLVGVIQYSDIIRHEFDLQDHTSKSELKKAASAITYLTGLTQTGVAIKDMLHVGFSRMKGARPAVAKIGIVITDGRSQDNVTMPSLEARNEGVKMFAIGVTDHVLQSELLEITGSKDRVFLVRNYTDLNTRLRSLIQKSACSKDKGEPLPATTTTARPGSSAGCDASNNTSCDRVLNEICIKRGRLNVCDCPEGFNRHPVTNVCGGQLCNPLLPTTCPDPETCNETAFGTFRCICPDGFVRRPDTGFCVSSETKITPLPDVPTDSECDCNEKLGEICLEISGGKSICGCREGEVRNPKNLMCGPNGVCDPDEESPCDTRKKEQCLQVDGGHHTCQCIEDAVRHVVTGVCLVDECNLDQHDCDKKHGKCTDTDDGYLCSCPPNFIDKSPDPVSKPGRFCVEERNECLDGTHNCSKHAVCTDTPTGFVCNCMEGFIDKSPNPQFFKGTTCEELVNECADSTTNDCSPHAICTDTLESYQCECKGGFVDTSPLENPGRTCQVEALEVIDTSSSPVLVERCSEGNNDCDPKAICLNDGDDFECKCPPGFVDRSSNPNTRPGRLCVQTRTSEQCDEATRKDCSRHAKCALRNGHTTCDCNVGYVDMSPDPNRPGRVCKRLDECASEANDCDKAGGICIDTPESYRCQCQPGFLDLDPTNPGRSCKKLRNECLDGSADCSTAADCIDTEDSYQCKCKEGWLDVSEDSSSRPGRRCIRLINECTSGLHSCHGNADCIDTPEAYLCECKPEFIDIDPANPGRNCRPKLVDECVLGLHNCDPHAICIDTAEAFNCSCPRGFKDISSFRPGTICVREVPPTTPVPPECLLGVSRSCHQNLNEVCRLVEAQPKCVCPEDFRRNPDTNVCSVINECLFPQLNDCSPLADCIDEVEGYQCKCKSTALDKSPNPTVRPGRVCIAKINECLIPGAVDCDIPSRADCFDLDEGYRCQCKSGFLDRSLDPVNRPGRVCRQLVNECLDQTLNSCDPKAICKDLPEGYQCQCPNGFLDVSPNPAEHGRNCIAIINECTNGQNDCDREGAICEDTKESFRCSCKPGFIDVSPNPAFPGRHCKRLINECAEKTHDCAPDAICRDTEDSFTCSCPEGFVDRSPAKLSRPGRQCVKMVDECATGIADCSANATCRDLEIGYTCTCNEGMVDHSPNAPGRVCQVTDICPANDCSPNALCERIGTDGFSCSCLPGFVDRSPPEKPGHNCERQTACGDDQFNNCSKNALCFELVDGYRCQCRPEFVDLSPDPISFPGRVCERPSTPATQFSLDECSQTNDCDPKGAICIDLPHGYRCECKENFLDASPDPRHPGRVCKADVNECSDKSLNTCDPVAICTNLPNGYTCQCPEEGYYDSSPNPNEPGRVCTPLVNECLLHTTDCDPVAECVDTPDSYRCRCPQGTKDISPSIAFPGRHCRVLVDECKQGTHDCDRNAICRDTEDSFVCTCPDSGFVDRSPSRLTRPGRVCIKLINECDEGIADCSVNATCRDLEIGFTCQCIDGTIDRSPQSAGRICLPTDVCPPNANCGLNAACIPLSDGSYTCRCLDEFVDRLPEHPGRICELRPPANFSIDAAGVIIRNPCLGRTENDCSPFAICRSISSFNYTCECAPNYEDKSSDPQKPGRVCAPQAPVCADPSKNDCHPSAYCQQDLDDSSQYVCSCRDGWRDLDLSNPGKTCVEDKNECLDSRLYNCSSSAICVDLPIGYACRCPPGTRDRNPSNPGTDCVRLMNECAAIQLNNCSRFAICTDLEDGYSCACFPNFIDASVDLPGRQCFPLINECESANLNDCDPHADCEDLAAGYNCSCRVPYVDESISTIKRGRICRLNECLDSRYHQCDANAVCVDTEDSYSCYCPEAFVDISPDPNLPGRRCVKASLVTTVPAVVLNVTQNIGVACGSRFCDPKLNEFCMGGTHCDCQPGRRRGSPNEVCQEVVNIVLPIAIGRRGDSVLYWTQSYGEPSNQRFIELSELFRAGIRNAIVTTPINEFFVDSEVNEIGNLRTLNGSRSSGLLFNFTTFLRPDSGITPQFLWIELLKTLNSTQKSLGGTELFVDEQQPNPFEIKTATVVPTCGGSVCNAELGEVCIANKVCGCSPTRRRKGVGSPCLDIVSFVIPLYVVRENDNRLQWTEKFSNPKSAEFEHFAEIFSNGIQYAFGNTSLRPYFVTSEIQEILNPKSLNSTWEDGLLFNFTTFFTKSAIKNPDVVWTELYRSIQKMNYSVGGTPLFIDLFQYNPFGFCLKHDCHERATCYEVGLGFACSCPADLVDTDPSRPGHSCRSTEGYNECLDPKDNDCHVNSTCIDDTAGYHCECKPGFTDFSPPNRGSGRICELDVCTSVSSVSFCPKNTTCRNTAGLAECQCDQSYMDVSRSPEITQLRSQGVGQCMAIIDVNECELGLTNCSVVANCTDLIYGYQCQCPADYRDGNPSLPGRLCAGASCGHCTGHGDCIPDEGSPDKIKCRCHNWYTGKQCEKDVRMILLVIFAVIFLILALCCLLYFCLRCRCIKGRELWYREPLFTYRKGLWPWSTLEQNSSSSESGAEFSGMSTSNMGKGSDYYPDMAIPRAKLAKGAMRKAEVKADSSLLNYLEGNKLANVRIPRAKVAAAQSAAELPGSTSVIFSDVHQSLPQGASMKTRSRWSAESGSSSSGNSEAMSSASDGSSSSGGYREEIERRVITDVKTTEYSRILNASEGNSSSSNRDATAVFHVYPPIGGEALDSSEYTTFSRTRHMAQSKSGDVDSSALFEAASSSEADAHVQSMLERDREQSTAEVSITGVQGNGLDWCAYADTMTTCSQPRAMSEYTERDLDDISEETSSDVSSSTVEENKCDKKVLVKKSHAFVPAKVGRGGTETFRTETSTKSVMREKK